MDELTQEFLAESTEGLDRMERCLTELEVRPDDSALLAEIFRAVHTIKGSTGFLEFERLERLAHAGESLLSLVRNGTVQVCEPLVTGLLQLIDRLRAVLLFIETTGGEGEDQDESLIVLLNELGAVRRAGRLAPVDIALLASSIRAGAHGGSPLESLPDARLNSFLNMFRGDERTVRVDVEILNRMIKLVGELVIARNEILQASVDSSGLGELAWRLDDVTTKLRATVMQVRMQSVGHLFEKYPRMVRDLAKSLGKRVRIEFYGAETVVDRSLLEAIKGPLAQVVRNAMDHGIESPEERIALGKPAEGFIAVRAVQRGGFLLIEIKEDGRGIVRERVLEVAFHQKLLTAEEAATMSDEEVLQIIFRPGFTTATELSRVSGRGVGMDVIRANVEGIGGRVELTSEPGHGATVRLRIPLTLAVLHAVPVRCGDKVFCLADVAVLESFEMEFGELAATVVCVDKEERFPRGDESLPLIRLTRLLDPGCPEPEHWACIVVLEMEGGRLALLVDELLIPQEIVVTPVPEELRERGLFSGTTVLKSGAAAMVLDMDRVALRSGETTGPERRSSQ